jgi:CheY-like chemotaxis protein
LDLRLDLPADSPRVMVDRLRIRQVLMNLLTNAARHTERGHITVRVGYDEREARVEVADTGPGIAAADVQRIFARFATTQTRRGEAGGTGLGLPISQRFVELHGGTMGVESAPGAGATFWFTLPAEAGGSAGASDAGALVRQRYLGRPQPLLLLAHPDASVARLLGRHLPGYRIETAADLSEAAERAGELRANAIVVDLFDDAPPGGAVPVIRCPLPAADELAARLGVADYLVKPISRETLLAAIDRIEPSPRTILVVDDDRPFARLLTRMLSSGPRRYEVRTAADGRDGLAKMEATAPDLVLLDLSMPGLDGAGVLERMRADPRLAATPVIMLSAHVEGEGRAVVGRELRLEKPEGFKVAELTRLLDALVGAMRPAADSGTAMAREPRPTAPQ